MGLDVYLYRYEGDVNEMLRRSREYIAKDSWLYEFEPDKEKRDAELEKLAEKLELGKYGEPESEKIEIDSSKYPEHMFKIGYWRSSYNPGGINRVLRNIGLMTLIEIMFGKGADNREYVLEPDWEVALERALNVFSDFCKFTDEHGLLRVNTVSMEYGRTKTHEEAIQKFLKKSEGNSKLERKLEWFSDRDGSCYMGTSMPVVAHFPGTTNILREVPCVYAVYRDIEEGKLWYRNALEIIVETLEWVIAQPDREQLRLHWSG